MRVLFCSTGGFGHIQPMRPLAGAFKERGHAVAWVTAPDALGWLDGQGMALFAAGPAFEPGRSAFRRQHAAALDLTGEALSAQVFPRLFGATLAPAMLDEVGRALDLWMPDLVVLEPAALAVPLACAQRGVPWVTHGYGLPVPTPYLDAAMRWFGPAWKRAGLPVPDHGGLYRHHYIDIAPPGLSAAGGSLPAPCLALNAYAARAASDTDEPLPAPPCSGDRARVYLSFGTVFNRCPALVHAARALAQTGAELLVTVGRDGDPRAFPVLPNVEVTTFIDQATVLPACDLVVSHGGAGTVLAAAAHGLPQIVLPQAADHFRNARALAQASVARVVEPAAQTPQGIHTAALQVMGHEGISTAARRLAAQMASMPLASGVARELEDRFSAA